MTTTMTRLSESTASGRGLLMALELSARTWKVGFTVGGGQRPRVRQIAAGHLPQVVEAIAEARRRFQLPAEAPVWSCYEAGREGFWVRRALGAQGVRNLVVDSSSIEVPRRARRAKTDGLDLAGLLRLLERHVGGERGVWHVVRVPTVAEEDARHRSRSRETLQQERTRLTNRLHGLLATQGLRVPIRADFLARLAAAQGWDGQPVPAGLQARLGRVWSQWVLLTTQLRDLDALGAVPAPPPAGSASAEAVRPRTTADWADCLQRLQGVGPVGASCLATEIFGWRDIQSRRELAALVGIVPAPYQSGDTAHDQGITRAGNRHVRRMMVQLAWSWVRYQPGSALSRWYRTRFHQGRRLRRIGIVALARKLLIALWRYGAQGITPTGAVLKSPVA